MADFGSGYMKRLKKMAGLSSPEELFANKGTQLLPWVDPGAGETLDDPNAPPPGDLSLSVGAPREVTDKLSFREPEALPVVPIEKPLHVSMGVPEILEEVPTSQHQPLPAPPGSLARIKGDDIPQSRHQPLTGDISRIKDVRRPSPVVSVSPVGPSGRDVTSRVLGMDLASNRLAGAVPQPGQSPALNQRQAVDEWAQGLQDAQGRAADSELMARLGELIDRAGSRFSRSGRVKPNSDFFRALAQDAQQPVTDFQQQYGMERQKRADVAAHAEGQSKLALLKERLAAEAAARGETARHNLATEQLGRESLAAKKEYGAKKLAQSGANAKTLAAATKEATRQREQAFKADKDSAPLDSSIEVTKKHLAAVDDARLGEYLDKMRFNERAGTSSKLLPGGLDAVGDFLSSGRSDDLMRSYPDASEAHRSAMALIAAFIQSQSGKAASDTERKFLNQIMMGGYTPQQLRQGIALVEEIRGRTRGRIEEAFPQASAKPGATPQTEANPSLPPGASVMVDAFGQKRVVDEDGEILDWED